MPKTKPPDTTNQILADIRRSNAAIVVTANKGLDASNEQLKASEKDLKVQKKHAETSQKSLDVQNSQLDAIEQSLNVQHEQLEVLKSIEDLESKQLEVQTSQLEVSTEALEVLKEILEGIKPKPHVYTVTIKKRRKPMSVQPGIPTGFAATMQDNGNPISLVSGVWSWETDGAEDTIETRGPVNEVAVITVPADPARESVTITASAADPTGAEQSGSLTVDIVPGVEHVFTVSVNQVFAQQLPEATARAPRPAAPAPSKHRK